MRGYNPMRRGTLLLLLFIVLLAAGAAFVDFWPNPDSKGVPWHGVNNPFTIKQGLDLQGGVSVLLVPDPAQHYTQQEIASSIDTTLQQIENRVNGGLGVSEPSIRILTDSKGNQSISLDLPGYNSGNQAQQINTLLKPGNLEFWDTGQTPLGAGTTLDPAQYVANNTGGKPLFTGKDLEPGQISVGQDPQTRQIFINFKMKCDAISHFGSFTGKQLGVEMTI